MSSPALCAVLSAPAFAFCFPFLKTVLTETTNDSEEQEDLLMQALQIINEHAQLRSSTASPEQLVDEVMRAGTPLQKRRCGGSKQRWEQTQV